MSTVVQPSSVPLRITTSTINVKHGALNKNLTFNTNLPLGAAMFINRIQFVVAVKDQAAAGTNLWQLLAQLTENTSNTTVNQSDPLAISNAFLEETQTNGAVGQLQAIRQPIRDLEDDFNGLPYPTLAQSLNLIASIIEVVGSGPPTNGIDVFAYIWYSLVTPIPQAIKDGLVNRLALQR